MIILYRYIEQNALPVSTSLWIPAFIFLSLSCDCSVYMFVIIPKRKKKLLFATHILPGAAHWCWDAQIALKAWTANRANVVDGNVDWMLAAPRMVFTKRWSDKHTGMSQSREYVHVAIGCSSPKDRAVFCSELNGEDRFSFRYSRTSVKCPRVVLLGIAAFSFSLLAIIFGHENGQALRQRLNLLSRWSTW